MPLKIELSDYVLEMGKHIVLLFTDNEVSVTGWEVPELACELMVLFDLQDGVQVTSERDRASVRIETDDGGWHTAAVVMGPDRFANVVQACVDFYELHPDLIS